MNRSEAYRYELPLLKQHESKMQHLRHEQKTEEQRLDRLKKTLQTRLHTDPREAKEIRAA